MNKKSKRLTEILIVVLFSSFIGMISGASLIFSMNQKKETKGSVSGLKEITSIYEKITEEYYEDVNEESLVEGAISGMLSILDPNSSYLDEKSTTSFNNKMAGEYYGIGIEALTLENTGVLVVEVIEDSPSHKAGILAGDIITKVNNESLKEKNASYFTSLISDLKNDIKLTLTRNGEELEKTLSAEKITIYTVTTNTFYKNYKKVGYIKISLFAANTASQFSSKLSELESAGIDSLIIDVRDNAGGYLSNAATILELFMKKDSILYKTEIKGNVSSRKDKTDEYRDYPVVILANGSSASASEVLIASFKDNYNVDIIGTTTYGKGTVQETVNVLEGSMAKLTIKKWLTPKGECIDGIGINPTIEQKIDDNYLNNPIFENDNQLEKAINVIVNK